MLAVYVLATCAAAFSYAVAVTSPDPRERRTARYMVTTSLAVAALAWLAS